MGEWLIYLFPRRAADAFRLHALGKRPPAGRGGPADRGGITTRDMQVSDASLLGTLQHIYYADRVWLARLEMRTLAAFVDP